MGGNNSRTRRLTRFLRRSERDRSDTEDDDDDEEWSEQPDEDETTGDDFDSGNVQNMIRHLLRYGLISRYLKLHVTCPMIYKLLLLLLH